MRSERVALTFLLVVGLGPLPVRAAPPAGRVVDAKGDTAGQNGQQAGQQDGQDAPDGESRSPNGRRRFSARRPGEPEGFTAGCRLRPRCLPISP